MNLKIEELTINDAEIVFDWVLRLLKELGEEGEEIGSPDTPRLLRGWRNSADRYHVFVAKTENGEIVGILTLSVTFAIYANGDYGVIDEMFVAPAWRSQGVGALLVNAAKELGKREEWARIDVTAPESDRWTRSRQFYEKLGFIFTGPKLKILLK